MSPGNRLAHDTVLRGQPTRYHTLIYVSGRIRERRLCTSSLTILSVFLFDMRTDPSFKIQTNITDAIAAEAVSDCHLLTSIELWRCRVPESIIALQRFFTPGKKNWGRVFVKAISNAFLALWSDRNDHHHGRVDAQSQEDKISRSHRRLSAVTTHLSLPDMPGIPKTIP